MNVLSAIVPVIVLIFIGVGCRKFHLISPQGMTDIKAVIANIMLPVTLFHALGNANYSEHTWVIVGVVLLTQAIAMLAGYPLRRLVHSENGKFLPILTTSAENGMLGYPLYIILCGQEMLGNMATIDIGATIFGFSVWCSVITQIESGHGIRVKEIGRMALNNPCLWGVVLGIAAGVSGFMNWLLTCPIGSVYQSTESLIVAPLSAMILIALGYDLIFDWEKIREVLSSVGIRFAIQMLVLAITWFTIGRTASYEMQTAILLYFFLPVAFSCQVYIHKEKSKTFIATFASLYSMITILAFVVLAVVR